MLVQRNKLFLAPAGKDKPLNRVLDGGTGTGIWAMDFGETSGRGRKRALLERRLIS